VQATTDLAWRDAVELAAALRGRELSATELLEHHLERIARIDPAVTAVVTVDAEGARAQAAAADAALTRGDAVGPLHGLPVVVKDLVDTAGLRTTYGSPLYRDHVPEADAIVVERLRAAGAVIAGKTNTPEFGAGSQTFNPVFGVTRNPYDPARTAGGSSGGAAAAVSCGLAPLADASDLASSIRNPASFCNVVGLRPTPGRVPDVSSTDAWGTMAVLGPIARSVRDTALYLRAVAGPDPRDPRSLPADLRPDLEHALDADVAGTHVAWSRDLGDLPVEPAVTAALEPARTVLAGLGCTDVDAEPDLTVADEAFETLRAVAFLGAHAAHLAEHPDLVKDTVAWNVERGRALRGEDVARALALRTEAFHRMRVFLEAHDVLALPVAQVVPFPVEVEWPQQVAGTPLPHYVAWLRSCSRITVVGCPAIAVPGGFTPEGLPVGLQLVGRPGGEHALLRVAYAFEQATRHGLRRPPVAS
jgi:amidase